MKSASAISVGSPFLILSITAFALFLPGPAQCQTPEIALLLQQTPSQGGIVNPQIGVHHFVLDTEVTIIAIPKPGYQFLYWLGDVLDKTANKTTTRLDKPKIIVAVFQQVDQDQLVVGQNRATTGGGGGSVFGAAVARLATRRPKATIRCLRTILRFRRRTHQFHRMIPRFRRTTHRFHQTTPRFLRTIPPRRFRNRPREYC